MSFMFTKYLCLLINLLKNKIILKKKLNIFHYNKTLIQKIIHIFLIQIHILTKNFSTTFNK